MRNTDRIPTDKIPTEFKDAVTALDERKATLICRSASDYGCTEGLLRCITTLIATPNNGFSYAQKKMAYKAVCASGSANTYIHNSMIKLSSRCKDYSQSKASYQSAINCGADEATYASMISAADYQKDFPSVEKAYLSALNHKTTHPITREPILINMTNEITHATMIKAVCYVGLFHTANSVCTIARELNQYNPNRTNRRYYSATLFQGPVFSPGTQTPSRFTHDPYKSTSNAAPA